MKLIPYYRVSTQKQGQSGLGLEAQQAAVMAYATATGSTLLAGAIEVESGKLSNRPKLAVCLNRCKALKATLVVAKLDRLSRNVAFLSALMESKVDFVCCDNSNATRLTLHILAAVAEDEARRISERTKAALEAYKARGGVLGAAIKVKKDGTPANCQNLTQEAAEKGSKLGAEAGKTLADEAAKAVYPILADLKAQGQTLRKMASELNRQGYLTRRGNPYNHMQVKLVLERCQ